MVHTVECRYNAVQYDMILHTSLQEQRQNIRAPQSYGVSFVNMSKKFDPAKTAPHCIWNRYAHIYIYNRHISCPDQ